MMRSTQFVVSTTGVFALSILMLHADPLRAQGQRFSVREGDVRVLCPLTIGGSFEAKTRMLSGAIELGPDPSGPLAGELVVELSGLDTGIALRNQHLRDNYLDVGKGADYARAILANIRLEGVDPTTSSGKGTFSGSLRLHGAARQVTGTLELRRSGAGLRVRASFPVVLADFGIAKPRYLGVGVKETVTVQVTFDLSTMKSAR